MWIAQAMCLVTDTIYNLLNLKSTWNTAVCTYIYITQPHTHEQFWGKKLLILAATTTQHNTRTVTDRSAKICICMFMLIPNCNFMPATANGSADWSTQLTSFDFASLLVNYFTPKNSSYHASKDPPQPCCTCQHPMYDKSLEHFVWLTLLYWFLSHRVPTLG